MRVSPATPNARIEELDRRAFLGGGGQLAPTLAMALAFLHAGPGPWNSQVEIHLERPPDWAVVSDRSAADDAVIAAMLRRVDGFCGWAIARDGDGSPLAVGRAVVVSSHVCVQAMATTPAHRRRGLASIILSELQHWAIDHGAKHAFLHVLRTNPAVEIYQRFGYLPLYEYHYRVAPDPAG